jgi:hypothetical protein
VHQDAARRRLCDGSDDRRDAGSVVVEIEPVDLLATLRGGVHGTNLAAQRLVVTGAEGQVVVLDQVVLAEWVAVPGVGDLVGSANVDDGAHAVCDECRLARRCQVVEHVGPDQRAVADSAFGSLQATAIPGIDRAFPVEMARVKRAQAPWQRLNFLPLPQ